MSDMDNSNTGETVEPSNAQSSPYDYLNRDFSSENFKIEVKNMPKFYGYNVRLKLDYFFVKFIFRQMGFRNYVNS